MGSTARRSLDSAASKRLNLSAPAGGAEESRQVAEQQLGNRAKGAQIQYSFAMPQDGGGGIIQALLPVDLRICGRLRLWSAVLSGDNGRGRFEVGAKIDPPAAYENPGSFAAAVADRGMCFCEPQLMARVPWIACVAIRRGVASDNTHQMANHHGWYLDVCASDKGATHAAEGAAHLESSLQMAARCVNAPDVKSADTRRAICVGCLMCSFSARYFRLPPSVAPKIDHMSERD